VLGSALTVLATSELYKWIKRRTSGNEQKK
jgi:hypothetical protein